MESLNVSPKLFFLAHVFIKGVFLITTQLLFYIHLLRLKKDFCLLLHRLFTE